MKKTILILMLALLLTGCAEKAPEETQPLQTTAETQTVQTTEEATQASETLYEEPSTEAAAIETISQLAEPSETLELSYDAYQVVYNIMNDGDRESAQFQGIGPDGSLVWTYETGSYPAAQLPRISPIGRWQDHYYLIEDGVVMVLDITTGTLLFENAEFSGTACQDAMVIDEYGYLYLAGYDSQNFFVMDPQGRSVKRIGSLSDAYVNPVRITIEEESVTVFMEKDIHGNSGDFPCTIRIDWRPEAKG